MAIRFASHPPTQGKAVEIYVAVLPDGVRQKPAKTTLVASAAAKGATSLSVTGITGAIQKGQYLLFKDTTDTEFLVEVTDIAAANATSLTVRALTEAIPAGAIAEYPTYIWDRKNADIDRAYKFSGVSTFNTGGAQDGIIAGVEKKITLPGLYYPKNAGYRTIKWCAENQREFWLTRTMPAPSNAFLSGDTLEGPAVCTNIKEAAPDEGFISADIEIIWLGKCVETDPVAAA